MKTALDVNNPAENPAAFKIQANACPTTRSRLQERWFMSTSLLRRCIPILVQLATDFTANKGFEQVVEKVVYVEKLVEKVTKREDSSTRSAPQPLN